MTNVIDYLSFEDPDLFAGMETYSMSCKGQHTFENFENGVWWATVKEF